MYNTVLVVTMTSLKGHFVLVLFFHFNIIKSHKEVETGELFYASNPFIYLSNK